MEDDKDKSQSKVHTNWASPGALDGGSPMT